MEHWLDRARELIREVKLRVVIDEVSFHHSKAEDDVVGECGDRRRSAKRISKDDPRRSGF